MPCSDTCACLTEPGLECLSVVNPRMFSQFREWCSLDESTEANRRKRGLVLSRTRIAFSSADELRKVLSPAPISGGATEAGCTCDCGTICFQCDQPLTGMNIKIDGPAGYTATAGAVFIFCTPAQFGAGTHSVETEKPGMNKSTVDAVLTGVCDSKTINPVLKGPPELDPIPDFSMGKLSTTTLLITGIDAGPNGTPPITVNAVSSNPQSVATPIVTYISPQDNGSLKISSLNVAGIAIITVTITNSLSTIERCYRRTFQRTFKINVG